jgi:O-antigen ligase
MDTNGTVSLTNPSIYQRNARKGRLFDIYVLGLTPLMTFFTINDSFSMYTLLPLTIVLLLRFVLVNVNRKSNILNKTLITSAIIVAWLGITLFVNLITNPAVITSMSLIRWFYIAEALLFFYLVTFKRYTKDELCDLFKVILFSGMIIAFAIIHSWVDGAGGKISLYSVYGNYVEENFTGSLLAIIFMTGVYKIYLSEKNVLLNLLQMGVITFGMALTGCRAAMVAVLGSLIIYFFTSTRFSSKAIRKTIIIVIFVVIVGFVLYKYIPAWTWARIFQNDYMDRSNIGRVELWRLALQGFLAHPIHGWGVGNFAMILFGRDIATEAHNSYLAMLLDGGIVYFLLMLSLVFSSIKTIVTKRKPFIAILSCFFVVTFIVEATRMAFFWYGLFLITIIATSPDLLERQSGGL